MSQKLESILLLGATGTIGVHILKAFAASRSSFKRVAILTSQNTVETKASLLSDMKKSGIETIVGDITDDGSMKRVFADFDTIISALGRTALHLQPNIVSAVASLSPPRRFYPSEYGTDIKYDPVTSPHEVPHQQKLKVRAHIEALAAAGKIEYTYIVTGPFADTFFFCRRGAGYLPDEGSYYIVGSPTEQVKISGTSYADTGKYVVSSVLTPQASRNATIRVSSFTSTPSEMLSAIETIIGKKLNVQYTSLADYKTREAKAWAEKDPLATVYTLTRIWYEGGSDFSKKPRAVYMKDGGDGEEEIKSQSDELFKDVPYTGLQRTINQIIS